MILEGRVHVTMGKENLAFESGPFSYFGTQALVMPPSESEYPLLTSDGPFSYFGTQALVMPPSESEFTRQTG